MSTQIRGFAVCIISIPVHCKHGEVAAYKREPKMSAILRPTQAKDNHRGRNMEISLILATKNGGSMSHCETGSRTASVTFL